jgi:hypothetical protein
MRQPSDQRVMNWADLAADKRRDRAEAVEVYWLESGKPDGVCSGKGRTGKEMIVAEIPENPTGASVPPPFQPVSSGFQPVSAAPPPKSGGGGAMKIILIILGIFAFLILLVVCGLAYACHRVKQAIQVDSKTGATSMSIPGMSMSADSGMKFTSSELGIDIYPGAEPSKSGNMRMNIAGSSVVSASFLTSDAKEKVVEFYKDKLGSNSSSMDFGESAILTMKKSDQDSVSVTITQQANQNNGQTQIHIQHTTVAKTN